MTERASETSAKSERERRLAAALRENLRKRKEQLRGRRSGEADGRSGLPALDSNKEKSETEA